MHIVSGGAKIQGDKIIVASLEKAKQSKPEQAADKKSEKTTAIENQTK